MISLLTFSLTGCAQIRYNLKTMKGELIGIHNFCYKQEYFRWT